MDQYIQKWREMANQSGKGDLYALNKDNFGLENCNKATKGGIQIYT